MLDALGTTLHLDRSRGDLTAVEAAAPLIVGLLLLSLALERCHMQREQSSPTEKRDDTEAAQARPTTQPLCALADSAMQARPPNQKTDPSTDPGAYEIDQDVLH